jgi:hypothetical protein
MPHYKKAIIALDGHSSKIEDTRIQHNVEYALSSLHIPYTIYEPHTRGLKKLEEDMNEEGVLYILNDSFQFHLCNQPNIIISRSPQWVQSTPKPNTIGVFTQQMVAVDASQMMSCIARNTPVRQHHDLFAASNYILTNEFFSGDTNQMARNGLAMMSWNRLIQEDMYTSVLCHTSEGLPFVNQMLSEALTQCKHPDDIIILVNRDICLVPQATSIIRTYMDLHNYSAVYAQRVDVVVSGLLDFSSIADMPEYEGADLFAFRPNAPVLEEILPVDLYLARAAWDSFWAYKIKNKLPYKVAYHHVHDSEWQTKDGSDGNKWNYTQISLHRKESDLGVENYERYFKGRK